MYNIDLVSFLIRNKIDLKNFEDTNLSYIYDPIEINSLVAKYGFYYDRENTHMSIADIIGYEKNIMQSSNIFLSISHFFDSNGDEYHARSSRLLLYDSNELLSSIKDTFINHPIVVKEMPDNKYIIVTNGFHRYTVLRAHFVKEAYNTDINSDEYIKLRKKYEIPLQMRRLDIIKTYCKLLLNNNPNFKGKIIPEYDENYYNTGNAVIKLSDKDILVNNYQLIEFTKLIIENTFNEDYFKLIKYYSDNFKDFKQFMIDNFPNIDLEQNNIKKYI